jgi:hypothetical protein
MKQYNLIFAVTAFCYIVTVPTGGIANEIGLFLNNETDCKISSSTGSVPCRKDTPLSAGDVITTKRAPAKLPIQWLVPNYVRLEPVEAGKYRVIFTPPAEKNGVLSQLSDLLGFVRKAGRISHVAVTRGGSASQQMLPGDGATLLPGYPVTFSWCVAGIKKIEISSITGAKVKEIAVPEGRSSVTVNPEDLGLEPMVFYHWKPLSSATEGGRIILLGGEKAKNITEGLLLIDKGQGTIAENELKKAVYLQFISENYTSDYSFGWLQYSLASELTSQLAADDRAAADLLKANSGISVCD